MANLNLLERKVESPPVSRGLETQPVETCDSYRERVTRIESHEDYAYCTDQD